VTELVVILLGTGRTQAGQSSIYYIWTILPYYSMASEKKEHCQIRNNCQEVDIGIEASKAY
jgi:hypothetical protein